MGGQEYETTEKELVQVSWGPTGRFQKKDKWLEICQSQGGNSKHKNRWQEQECPTLNHIPERCFREVNSTEEYRYGVTDPIPLPWSGMALWGPQGRCSQVGRSAFTLGMCALQACMWEQHLPMLWLRGNRSFFSQIYPVMNKSPLS